MEVCFGAGREPVARVLISLDNVDVQLARSICAACGRELAVTKRGRIWRHRGRRHAPQRLDTVERPIGSRDETEMGAGTRLWQATAEPLRAHLRSEANAGLLWSFWVNDSLVTAPRDTLTVTARELTWDSWTRRLSTSDDVVTDEREIWTAWARNFRATMEREYGGWDDQPPTSSGSAAVRASATLTSLLTAEQRRQYAERRFFDVVGSRGGRYRIRHGCAGNVCRLADSRETDSYCAHPPMRDEHGALPYEDAMIAQLLALTADEDGFLAVANVTRG